MMLDRLVALTLLSTTIVSVGLITANHQSDNWKDETAIYTLTTPTAPKDFKVLQVEHNWARLSWSSTERKVNQFNIYRNGTLISKINGNNRNFTDLHLKGSNSYLYSISAVKNNLSSSRVNLTLTTKVNQAPLFQQTEKSIKIGGRNFGNHVHTLKANDPNNDKIYYSIEGKDSGLFLINEDTGKIIIKKDLLPNKEYTVSGFASDGYNKDRIELTIKS